MYLSIWIGIVMSTSQSGCSVFPKKQLADGTEVRRAVASVETVAAPKPQATATVGGIINPDSPLPKVPPPGVRVRYTSIQTEEPVVAMTFDDGPHATNTPRLLDILKERNIKATFFVVGKCAQEYPHIIRRILAEGHEIGNHTWDHQALNSLSDEQVRAELKRTEDAVFNASGYRIRTMRPPYGATNLRLNQMWFKEFGYPTMMWSVDPLDWKNRNAATVTSRIVGAVHKGAIILAHDIHATTISAMPGTLDQILAKGYRFVTVSQLLNLEKNTMPVGVVMPPSVDPSEMPEPAKAKHSS